MSLPENKTLIKRKKESKKEDQSLHPQVLTCNVNPLLHSPPTSSRVRVLVFLAFFHTINRFLQNGRSHRRKKNTKKQLLWSSLNHLRAWHLACKQKKKETTAAAAATTTTTTEVLLFTTKRANARTQSPSSSPPAPASDPPRLFLCVVVVTHRLRGGASKEEEGKARTQTRSKQASKLTNENNNRTNKDVVDWI